MENNVIIINYNAAQYCRTFLQFSPVVLCKERAVTTIFGLLPHSQQQPKCRLKKIDAAFERVEDSTVLE